MPKQVTEYRIFISSPSDVAEERDALEAVIQDLQATLGKQHSLHLKALRWEKDGRPAMGDPQENLFAQLGEYDIFVGIFWKRFGTPTAEHESGSEAEFRDAYAKWEEDNSRPILMYFCERPANIDVFSLSPEELAELGKQAGQVKKFQQEIAKKGLYWTYTEQEDFQRLTHQHLYDAIVKLIGAGAKIETAQKTDQTAPQISADVQVEKVDGGKVVGIEYNFYMGEDLDAREQQSRLDYLQALYDTCQVLPLAQLGRKATDVPVMLSDVYIKLNTKTKVQLDPEADPDVRPDKRLLEGQESKILSAKEAADGARRMVLLGGPGSGKSTFVKQWLAGMAAAQSKNKPGLLPVFLYLRDLAPRLGQATLNGLAQNRREEKLVALILEQAIHDLEGMQVREAEAVLRDAFKHGGVCLVLDGLDEVPYSLRGLVRESVAALRKIEKVVVTCRVRSYTGEAQLGGFKVHQLAHFDDEQIQNFIAGWYNAQTNIKALTRADATKRTKDLQQAAQDGYIRQLAETPMLLTTMIIVHQEEAELPRESVVLYEKAVEILLRKWQLSKGELPKELADILDRKERIRPIMERLAFEAQCKGAGDKAADLPRKDALDILEKPEYLADVGIADKFLDYVDKRAGLLVGRGGGEGKPETYSFPHRTFQEYLAGCYLVNRRSPVREIQKLATEGDFWSVAVQMGAQELLFNKNAEYLVLDNAKALLPEKVNDEITARQALWSAHMAQVAGKENVERDEATGQNYLDRVREALINSFNTDLPPVERAEGGRLLAKLGDPRQELLTLEDMLFCFVPAGECIMGSPEGEGRDNEHPQHQLNLPYAYWIGQAPVTQSQFRLFVDADGYKNKEWWTDAGWTYIQKQNRTAPYAYGDRFDLNNHPVVGVSLFEAHAFTKWLTQKGREYGWLSDTQEIALPNEPEWEKAARGGLNHLSDAKVLPLGDLKSPDAPAITSNEKPDRQYAWGNQMKVSLCNIEASGIGATSTPGCFPKGKNSVGCYDMSGNVWEWTRSKHMSYPYTSGDGREQSSKSNSELRVFRGGSFDDFDYEVRCAYRYRSLSLSARSYVGFRVVSLPLPGINERPG